MNSKLLEADAALREGRKGQAADLIIAVLAAGDTIGRPAWLKLLHLLLELQRHDEGARWAGEAVAAMPRDYDLLNLSGAFLRLTNNHAAALATLDQAIKLKPGEIAAQVNKGHLLNDMKNGAAAEILFTKLLRQHPRLSQLHRPLANALATQGKFDQAERRLRHAIALDRKDIDSWLDYSALAADRADSDEALARLDQAIAANTDNGRLLKAKAVMLRHAGKSEARKPFLDSLLPRFEKVPWVQYEFGRWYVDREPHTATTYFRRAVELDPKAGEYRLALAYHLLRTPSQTIGEHIELAYRILMTCPPLDRLEAGDARVRTQIFTRVADFERAQAVGSFRDLGRLWADNDLHTALLNHLSQVVTPEDRHESIAQHRLWGDKAIERARRHPISFTKPGPTSGKIRLGFMSSDLREHPVTYFAWPLFEHADRERFEIYCYSYYLLPEATPLQRRVTDAVDHFRWHRFITNHDAAQMVADDQLDILFELGGSTHMNKLEVMAWKPARLCASWLGYPHSSGLSTIDYLLVDPFLNPPDPSLLIEQPLIMPKSWIVMGELAFPQHLRINPLSPVARNGFINFGTANNSYKFNPAMLRAWAQVMKRVPNSRFIFVRPEAGAPSFVRHISRYFEEEGIAAERLQFRPVLGQHMAHYNDIDIALDTFPQTGGTTTCEALWMGVPTVTLVGEALFERLSYSILQNAGLGDLCATTPEQFIEIAVALAADTDRIQALRTGLRDQIKAGPLGQTEQFARDFYDLIARTVAADRERAASPAADRS